MRKYLTMALAAGILFASNSPALAFLEFYKQWVEIHVDETDTSTEAQEFRKLVTDPKTRCLVCHQGKLKKNHNPYGQHFVGVIDKTHKKDVQKIKDTINDVAKKKSDPEDSGSKTYAELLKEFKLPGGTLEELQAEPPKEDK